MISSEEIENVFRLIKANSHSLKVKLTTLLRIYGSLSTSELVNKTGRSKPTVLKHLEELVDLGTVEYITETSPGAYDRRIYQLSEPSWLIRGQNIREKIREEPESARLYVNYQIAVRKQLKEIIDLTVDYQQRLSQELDRLLESDDDNLGDQVVELMQDHLGQFKTNYTSKFEETGHGSKDIKEFMKIELFLPIRRIIEQMSRDDWVVDGTLWEHF